MRHLASSLAILCLSTTAFAEDTVKVATDTQAASALDSVLDNVVTGSRLIRAKGASASAKGTIEIRKVDGGKPRVKGSVLVGTRGSASWHKRTIDWDFATGTGTFSSERATGRDPEHLTVVADSPTHTRQTFSSTIGAIVREDSIDTQRVTLKTGGTADVVRTRDLVTVGAAAAAAFAATGQPAKLVKAGYLKSSGAGGAEVYTREQITVGSQTVTAEQLAGFLQNRVAR